MNLINLTTRSLRRFSLYLQRLTYIFTKYFWYIYVLQRNIIRLTNCLTTKQRYKNNITFSFTKYHIMLISGVKKTKMFVLGIYVNLDLPNHILTSWSKYISTKTQCPDLVVQQARSRYISTGFATLCKKLQLNWPRRTHDLILFSSNNSHLSCYQINCNLIFVPY